MKYKVGIDYTIRGVVYFEVASDSEDNAAKLAEKIGEDYAVQHIQNGNGHYDAECCDSKALPKKEG